MPVGGAVGEGSGRHGAQALEHRGVRATSLALRGAVLRKLALQGAVLRRQTSAE